MENDFKKHVTEWREMNQSGRFAEARQYYFEQLFEEVIENFERETSEKKVLEPSVDVLFSVLGFTPEPIILAARALKPKRHIIFHDSGVKFNEDNMRYLSKFLPDGFDKIELSDESFSTIYDVFKRRMALTAGRNYTINITGGKKSMVAAASIFARDFNASVIYVDYNEYDANLRRPTPGTEYLNVVYSPIRDLPELFHNGVKSFTGEPVIIDVQKETISKEILKVEEESTVDNNEDEHDGKIPNNQENIETEHTISEKNILREQDYHLDNIQEILGNKDWVILKKYLDCNLHGTNVRSIQLEVTEAIESLESLEDYWKAVSFFIDYNAAIFMGVIAKANITKIDIRNSDINSDVLDAIVRNAFGCSNKLKAAIELLIPYRRSLSSKQKEFILESCTTLPTSDSYYELFKLTGISPDCSIDYLSNLNSKAAAYTIYKIYSDGQKNGLIREDCKLKSLRPSVIRQTISIMQKSESIAFQAVVLLIKSQILLEEEENLDKILLAEIKKYGYEGFNKYITVREQKLKSKKAFSSTAEGDLLSKLQFIKPLGNHFLFNDNETHAYALLDKILANEMPSKLMHTQAKVFDIKMYNGKRVFFVTQKELPVSYSNPCLINVGDVLEINFSQQPNGEWIPIKNNYCKVLETKLVSMPKNRDYRKKQRARVVKIVNFFTCMVELL